MNDATTPLQITRASVKVMRSYDYCHFEVLLGHDGTLEDSVIALEQIDNLRKEAARLADKAVAQYKIAKEVAENRASAQRTVEWRKKTVEKLKGIPEENRSVEERAEIKAYDDAVFAASRSYDYEDDWQDEDEE